MNIQTGAEVFRDYEIENVPASGPNTPDKREIRAYLSLLESLLNASGAGLAFSTLAALLGNLTPIDGTLAMVYADATPANNGQYRKSGATGVGTWTRVGDSPRGVVRLTVTGGTGNAIAASAPETPIVPGDKLYLLTPGANNTAATTINVNAGGLSGNILNSLGSSLAANTLVNGLPVLMAWQTDHFVLLVSTPVDTSGMLTDAIAARDAASGYATAAASSASALANQVHQYDTRALAAAATIPVGVAAIKITRYATGYPLAYATYIPGTISGPLAFAEAGGHYWQLDVSAGTLLIPWFGAKGDGTTTDTTAVSAAYAAASGKRLDGMGLNYKIASTVTGQSNVETVNAKFTQSTHSAHPMFDFGGKTEWKFRSCKFVGDQATDLDYTGSPVGVVTFGNSGSSDLTGIAIEDSEFYTFADAYIINGTITGTGGIRNTRFNRNKIYSNLGANYVDQSHFWLSLYAIGSSAGTTGRYFDTEIMANYIDADSLTIPIAPWSGHTRIQIKNNVILNPGARSLFNPAVGSHNCYGMIGGYDAIGALGSTDTCGQDGEISGNLIVNPPSAGIYFAIALDFNVHDNTIIGQFRTDDSTLSRAGIACTDLRKSRIHHNRMINCWGGIAATSMSSGSDILEIEDNDIYGSSASDSYGIRAGSQVGTSAAWTIAIRRNTIRLTGSASSGVRQTGSDSSDKLGSLTFEGNDISSPFVGINIGASFLTGKAIFKGNRYSGVLSSGGLLANSVSGLVMVQNETFDMATTTGIGMNVDASTVAVNGAVFNGKTSGSACISAIGTLGTLEGVSYRGCTASLRLGSSSTGTTTNPTISGTQGDFWQNAADNYTELGSTSSKFIVRGWSCAGGTTWLQHRELTGN